MYTKQESEKLNVALERKQMALMRHVQIGIIEHANMAWYEQRIDRLIRGEELRAIEPDLRRRYADHFRRRVEASKERIANAYDQYWKLEREATALVRKLYAN